MWKKFIAGEEVYMNTIKQWIERSIYQYRMIFVVSFCTGLLAYGFMMTNIINIHDNIANTPGGYGVGLRSGRWFLQIIGTAVRRIWNGNYTLPLFNGMFAIFLISISACIVSSILKINSPILGCICGMLLISFPTLAASMFFMFTVHYYSLAVLLSVMGVYFGSKQIRGGICLAAGCFALSLGIYQAYMPIAISLYLLLLLRRGFSDPVLSGKQFFMMGVKYLISIVLGFAFYYVVLQGMLIFYGDILSDHQGISQMGIIKIIELPEMLKCSYKQYWTLSTQPQYSINLTRFTKMGFLFSQLTSVVLFAYLECIKKLPISIKIWNAVIFLLFPIGVNSIILMCFHSNIYSLMVYGIVAVFFQPVILLELLQQHASEVAARKLASYIAKYGIALTILILSMTSLNYVWQANGNYVALYYANRQIENYFAGLIGKIRSIEGYREELPLAVIGHNFKNTIASPYRDLPYFQFQGNHIFINDYSRDGWFRMYLGFKNRFATYEELTELESRKEIGDMPCYPREGSIQIIDGIIVLKIEDL